jgi:hypothetical protein
MIPARVVKQYSIQNKKQLHGKSKVLLQGNLTIEALDLLVFG